MTAAAATSCEHPTDALIPRLRAGAPSGYATCRLCGATVRVDPTTGDARPGAPITGL